MPNAFSAEQENLRVKVESGKVRYTYLDPDGTWAPWLLLVLRGETGMVYETQCGGTSNKQRLAEGFMVPLGGASMGEATGPIDLGALNAVFHRGRGCLYDLTGANLPAERMDALSRHVESIPYWNRRPDGSSERISLKLDPDRLSELCEAWIPVLTPDGPGVLLYENCD